PVFFFSSRRRHTRFSRDWSSDVCSSDLGVIAGCGRPDASSLRSVDDRADDKEVWDDFNAPEHLLRNYEAAFAKLPLTGLASKTRSEERRVGKESRGRGERSDAGRHGEQV